jgi:hypothetical protein
MLTYVTESRRLCNQLAAARKNSTGRDFLRLAVGAGAFIGCRQVHQNADAIGGSPYGPATVAGPDGTRVVADVELVIARNLGLRLARVASAIKMVRATSIRGQDIDAPEYGTQELKGV